MASLEKRVQVLFSAEQYARLEAAAKVERMSDGAYIRDAVERRMRDGRVDAMESLQRLFQRADADPIPAPTAEEWDLMKDEMWDRPLYGGTDSLREGA